MIFEGRDMSLRAAVSEMVLRGESNLAIHAALSGSAASGKSLSATICQVRAAHAKPDKDDMRLHIDETVRAALAQEGAARRVPADWLAARLLELIVEFNMFDAVLDGDAPRREA